MLKFLIIFLSLLSCNNSSTIKSTILREGYYRLILTNDYQRQFIRNFMKFLLEREDKEFTLENIKAKLKEGKRGSKIVETLESLNKTRELESASSIDSLIKLIEIALEVGVKRENRTILELLEINYIVYLDEDDQIFAKESFNSNSKSNSKILERNIHDWGFVGKLTVDRKNMQFYKNSGYEKILKFKDGIFHLLDTPLSIEYFSN